MRMVQQPPLRTDSPELEMDEEEVKTPGKVEGGRLKPEEGLTFRRWSSSEFTVRLFTPD